MPKLRGILSGLLTLVGLALIGYGIAYWWKGFPYPVAMLLAYSAYGCLALGWGLSLRRPDTIATLAISAVTCALSAVFLIALRVIPPWPPQAIALFLASCVGTASSYRRLQRRLEARKR